MFVVNDVDEASWSEGEAKDGATDRPDLVETIGLCTRHGPVVDRPLRLGPDEEEPSMGDPVEEEGSDRSRWSLILEE